MLEPGSKVYRASVLNSSSASGEVEVALSSFGLQNGHISLSKMGRYPLNGVWKVPAVGDQVLIAGDDDFLTSAYLIPSSSFDVSEANLSTSEPTGFVNRTDSTISFTTATRTFTIAPVGSGFDVWVGGVKFPKTVAESVVIPNTSGIHYVYYNTSGVLTAKTTYFDLSVDAPVSYIYWNATDSTQYYFADERHGLTMDWATHEYLHRTRGAAFASGFTLTGYTTVGDGSANSHAQVSLDNGTFFDEDIEIAVTHAASPVPNTWEQRIQSNGYFPVFYRSGSAWKKDVATQYPLKFTTLATYNLNTAGSWSAQAVSSNKFGVYWIVATSNLNEPVLSVMGQNEYNTVGEAEATQWASMDLTGLPIYEFRTLYRLIFQTATGYANSVKSRLVSVTDMRTTGSGVSGSPVPSADHGSLTGLGDDDHVQYFNQTRGDARYLLTGSTLAPVVTASSLTSVGALTGGSIASGFGNINIGTNTFTGNGSGLTTLNATNISSGTIANARTTATNANTASTIVARDASGNFTAGTITATLSGAAPAGSLSGATLAAGVTASSLTSVGTLTGLTSSGRIYSQEWIEFQNSTGLYSPTNGAHFRPNPGSYGAWQVLGTRNTWGGLEFGDIGGGPISLMVNNGAAWGSQTTGMHNNVHGWLWSFSHQSLNAAGITGIAGNISLASFATSASTSGYQTLMWNTTFGVIARLTSKRATKDRITPLDNTGTVIDALRPVSFIVCAPEDEETPDEKAWREADVQHGFIAEEVAEVDEGRWAVWEPDEEGGIRPAMWRQHDLIALLVAEVKSLRTRVDALETTGKDVL